MLVSQQSYVLLACWLIAGCSSARESPSQTDADTDFAANKAVFAPVQRAAKPILYEGLPHQGWEPKQLAEQMRLEPTVMLHGYPFYRERLTVPPEDKQRLRALLGTATSFSQWQGEAACGGYHPDYCIEWSVGREIYRFLVCFGCSEAKVYGPRHSLRCDIRRDAYERLGALLKKHRKNRPNVSVG